MVQEQWQQLKRTIRPFWVFSPERLWRLSIALTARGHWVLAFWLKHLNSFLYHNSLSPGATVGADVWLGHNGLGIVVNPNVEIGSNVLIWHHVTLAAGRAGRSGGHAGNGAGPDGHAGQLARIVVEDNVVIGANAVVIAPRGRTLRIGRGARIGAGTVVTDDVPAGATLVGPSPRLVEARQPAAESE